MAGAQATNSKRGEEAEGSERDGVSPEGREVAWGEVLGARARAPGTEAGPEPGSATWPASPHLDAGSVGGAYPGARPPSRPPGLPLCTHLRRSSRGSRPRPGSAQLGAPVPAATGEQGRDGRRDPEGRVGRGAARVAGGGQRAAGARTGRPRARRPRRALSRLGRPRCGSSAPTRRSPAQAPSDWLSMTSRPAPS